MADFPINAVARRAQYVVGSSGQAGPYAFSFPILDDDDIAVYVGSTLKTKTTHYTVTRSLATGTGSITFVGGQEPVENDLVTLISAQALARTSDYTSGGDLQASSLNDDLDRLTIGQQQIAETLDRSVQLPLFTSRDTSSLGVGPLLFPYDATPANQANKVIGYDAAGTSLVALTPNSGTLITTPGSATDNAIVRFDGTTGTGFQNSPVTIDDAGAVAGVTTLNGTAVTALLDTTDIGVTVQGYDAALASLAGLSLAAGDVLYATGANTLARLPIGTAGQALTVNSGATAPEWADAGGGAILQTAYAELRTSGTATAQIPLDATIPQQTEGHEILTVSITPTKTTSKLWVQANVLCGEEANTSDTVIAALFRDSTADAIAADFNTQRLSGGLVDFGVLQPACEVTSGSTSATTFKLRIGLNTSNAIRWNGVGGVDYLSTATVTWIRVLEIDA